MFLANHDLSHISLERCQVIECVNLANMINVMVSFNHGCDIKLMKEKVLIRKGKRSFAFPEL